MNTCSFAATFRDMAMTEEKELVVVGVITCARMIHFDCFMHFAYHARLDLHA